MMHSVNQYPAIKELGNFSFTCVSPRNLIQGGGKVGSSFLFKRLCVYLCCVIGISPFYPLLHNMFIISLISQALMHELNMQLKGCEEWLHVYDVLEFEGENEGSNFWTQFGDQYMVCPTPFTPLPTRDLYKPQS